MLLTGWGLVKSFLAKRRFLNSAALTVEAANHRVGCVVLHPPLASVAWRIISRIMPHTKGMTKIEQMMIGMLIRKAPNVNPAPNRNPASNESVPSLVRAGLATGRGCGWGGAGMVCRGHRSFPAGTGVPHSTQKAAGVCPSMRLSLVVPTAGLVADGAPARCLQHLLDPRIACSPHSTHLKTVERLPRDFRKSNIWTSPPPQDGSVALPAKPTPRPDGRVGGRRSAVLGRDRRFQVRGQHGLQVQQVVVHPFPHRLVGLSIVD